MTSRLARQEIKRRWMVGVYDNRTNRLTPEQKERYTKAMQRVYCRKRG